MTAAMARSGAGVDLETLMERVMGIEPDFQLVGLKGIQSVCLARLD